MMKSKDIMLTKQLSFLLCFVAALWLVACKDPAPTSIQLNQPFTNAVNQPAQLNEKGLSVTFQDVLEDSRCPSNVQCFQAGQARISLVQAEFVSERKLRHCWACDRTNNPSATQV